MNVEQANRGPLIIYHAACADGAGAAFAAWLQYRDVAEYRGAKYGDPAPTDDEVRGREVYILDFSYKLEEMQRIASASQYTTILDHHKTARENLVGLDAETCSAVFSTELSGAVLAWRYFWPDQPVPALFLYIQDCDLWQWLLPHSQEISAALELRGVRDDWRVIEQICPLGLQAWEWSVDGLVGEGAVALRMKEQQVAAIAKRVEEVYLPLDDERDVKCLAVNSPIHQSEIGNLLADETGMVAAVWFWDGARQVFQVSLRSVGITDVSEIAKHRGGGGHKNAAGFTCDRLPWKAAS